MPAWIRRPAEAARAPDLDRAYEQGREDAHKRDKEAEAAYQAAYQKGRKDERADRKRHPFLMTILFVLAAAGAFLIALAAWNGSFTDGGQVADTAAERAAPVVEDAARDAGAAIRETGREITDRK